jgi:hypothetical protein
LLDLSTFGVVSALCARPAAFLKEDGHRRLANLENLE